jgi:heterodisulfide reductase subunit A
VSLATAIVPPTTKPWPSFSRCRSTTTASSWKNTPSWGPVEFATDGVFLCGMAHYPSPSTRPSPGQSGRRPGGHPAGPENPLTSGTVAESQPGGCSQCGVCVSICPYSAPAFRAAEERFWPGRAEINPVLCKGCGLCVASCRSGAIHLKGFDNDQIFRPDICPERRGLIPCRA